MARLHRSKAGQYLAVTLVFLAVAGLVWAATGTYRETRIPNFVNGIQVNGTTFSDGSGNLTTQTTLTAEGATADAFETIITFTDPTADNAITWPDAAGSPMLTSLATNAVDVANSVTGVSNGVEFEGATADAFETTVSPTDPTADRTVTLPDAGGTVMLSSLATNGAEAANSVTGASNALVYEGATADAFELSVVPQDVGADATHTLPAATGAVNVGVTHQVVLCGQMGNSATHYTSPVTGFPAANTATDFAEGGTACDAEDNGTEATADEILYTGSAFKVLGLWCQVSSSGSNGVTINLRSAAADLTPDITMTIATGTTGGVATAATTTDVAANATFALKTVSTEDLSAADVWCIANVMMVP